MAFQTPGANNAPPNTSNFTFRPQMEQSMQNTSMASISPTTSTTYTQHNRSRMSPQALRDQESVIARLQKQLFNMKLRVYYLEERLAKSGRQGGEDMSSLMKENYDQAMLLDEKTAELEDRNLLLVKARNAIESLRTDLEMARGHKRDHADADAAVRLQEQTQQFEEYKRKMESELQTQKASHQQVSFLSRQLFVLLFYGLPRRENSVHCMLCVNSTRQFVTNQEK